MKCKPLHLRTARLIITTSEKLEAGGVRDQGEAALLGLSKQLTKPQRKPDSMLLSLLSDPNAQHKGQNRAAQSRDKHANHIFLQGKENKWADGWMDRQTDGWTDGSLADWLSRWRDGWMDGRLYAEMDRWRDGWINKWVDKNKKDKP